MGRGRAKAKQTKVARRLKYYSPETDLNALARELGASGDPAAPEDAAVESADEEFDEDDAYERWASSEN
ncbi:DUF3073 domain-containing protein [Ornithinimicrobium sp. F0845]|uniref:DUF3073 domain-containing protein n=1 Tax=Ornithinimicrobium sp. F0845 TaxID=2926412 RepID=UPI001FF1EAC8|nr:DUF3073 domain-containing protein [Ornithinimicrobium sp. F0845]MCK0110610.1 DUF3073 domain-containing protein [Ornithinimicrobium sp. F0845]